MRLGKQKAMQQMEKRQQMEQTRPLGRQTAETPPGQKMLQKEQKNSGRHSAWLYSRGKGMGAGNIVSIPFHF